MRLASNGSGRLATAPAIVGHRFDQDWERLAEALSSEQETLEHTIAVRIIEQIQTYRRFADHELPEAVPVDVGELLGAVQRCHRPSGAELGAFASIGTSQAHRHIRVEDMLRAWRIAIQAVVDRAKALATTLGLSDRLLLEFVDALRQFTDAAIDIAIAAHRRAELEFAGGDRQPSAAFVRGLLLGTLASADIAVEAGGLGLSTEREYVAALARVSAGESPERLACALGFRALRSAGAGMSTTIAGDLAGFLPVAPSASAAAALKATVGVGAPRKLPQLAESFQSATRALRTALAFGLTGVHDVEGLGLRAAIVADTTVGEALHVKYIAPIKADPSGTELIASVSTYLESGRHVGLAASRLFVHQNTLRYRLARFEALTGANLRELEVAFEVWWALARNTTRCDAP